MKRALWFTIPVLLGVSGPAQAEFYGSLSGMAVFVPDTDIDIQGLPNVEARFDPGWGVAGALGYGWDLPTINPRLEAEVAYRRSSVKDVDIEGERFGTSDSDFWATSGMVNGAVDLDIVPIVTPYVMTGLGFAVVDGEDTDADTVFAYQAGAGLGYGIGPATLFIGYRYFATSQVDLEGSKFDLETHNVEAGVRFGF